MFVFRAIALTPDSPQERLGLHVECGCEFLHVMQKYPLPPRFDVCNRRARQSYLFGKFILRPSEHGSGLLDLRANQSVNRFVHKVLTNR